MNKLKKTGAIDYGKEMLLDPSRLAHALQED
jgi:hypothetical protein